MQDCRPYYAGWFRATHCPMNRKGWRHTAVLQPGCSHVGRREGALIHDDFNTRLFLTHRSSQRKGAAREAWLLLYLLTCAQRRGGGTVAMSKLHSQHVFVRAVLAGAGASWRPINSNITPQMRARAQRQLLLTHSTNAHDVLGRHLISVELLAIGLHLLERRDAVELLAIRTHALANSTHDRARLLRRSELVRRVGRLLCTSISSLQRFPAHGLLAQSAIGGREIAITMACSSCLVR